LSTAISASSLGILVAIGVLGTAEAATGAGAAAVEWEGVAGCLGFCWVLEAPPFWRSLKKAESRWGTAREGVEGAKEDEEDEEEEELPWRMSPTEVLPAMARGGIGVTFPMAGVVLRFLRGEASSCLTMS